MGATPATRCLVSVSLLVVVKVAQAERGGVDIGRDPLILLGHAREDDERPDGQPEESDDVIVHQEELPGHKMRMSEAPRGDAPLAMELLHLAWLVAAVGGEGKHLNAHADRFL